MTAGGFQVSAAKVFEFLPRHLRCPPAVNGLYATCCAVHQTQAVGCHILTEELVPRALQVSLTLSSCYPRPRDP